MAYSEMPVHSIVEPDRGRVEDAWLQGVFFCLRDDLKLGVDPGGGEVKRYEVEGGEKGGERETIQEQRIGRETSNWA